MEKIDARKHSPETQYELRKQVVRLRKQRFLNKDVAEGVGVSVGRASKIWQSYKRGGSKAIKLGRRGCRTGEKRTLTAEQEGQVRAVSELDQHRYFCVVGTELADFLQKTGTAKILGSQIAADGRAFTVIGVLDNVAEGGLRPYGMNRAMMIPISTALRTFQSPEITTVMARVAPHVPISQIKADILDYSEKKARGMQVEVTSAE